jgi:hypothetical protein
MRSAVLAAALLLPELLPPPLLPTLERLRVVGNAAARRANDHALRWTTRCSIVDVHK